MRYVAQRVYVARDQCRSGSEVLGLFELRERNSAPAG